LISYPELTLAYIILLLSLANTFRFVGLNLTFGADKKK